MCLVVSDSLRVMSLQEMWTYEGPASLDIFFSHIVLPICFLTHSSRSSNRDTPGGAPKVLRLGALGVTLMDERFARTSLKKRLVVL